MITPERILMPASQLVIARKEQLANEVRRLHSEIRRLVTDELDSESYGVRRKEAAYLLTKSETE